MSAAAMTTAVSRLTSALRLLPSRGLSTSAASDRWHADRRANNHIYRHGYTDRVKRSGALPRLTNDTARIRPRKVYTPSNPFAPSVALYGQNDYIDILGEKRG